MAGQPLAQGSEAPPTVSPVAGTFSTYEGKPRPNAHESWITEPGRINQTGHHLGEGMVLTPFIRETNDILVRYITKY